MEEIIKNGISDCDRAKIWKDIFHIKRTGHIKSLYKLHLESLFGLKHDDGDIIITDIPLFGSPVRFDDIVCDQRCQLFKLLCVFSEVHKINFCPYLPDLASLMLNVLEDYEVHHIIHLLIKKSKQNGIRSQWQLPLNHPQEVALLETFNSLMSSAFRQTGKRILELSSPMFSLSEYSIWFNRFFRTVLPMECVYMVVDMFLLESAQALVRFGLSLVEISKKESKKCYDEETFWASFNKNAESPTNKKFSVSKFKKLAFAKSNRGSKADVISSQFNAHLQHKSHEVSAWSIAVIASDRTLLTALKDFGCTGICDACFKESIHEDIDEESDKEEELYRTGKMKSMGDLKLRRYSIDASVPHGHAGGGIQAMRSHSTLMVGTSSPSFIGRALPLHHTVPPQFTEAVFNSLYFKKMCPPRALPNCETSGLLTLDRYRALFTYLPAAVQLRSPTLMYSSLKDGLNTMTLFDRARDCHEILLIILVEDSIVGVFLPQGFDGREASQLAFLYMFSDASSDRVSDSSMMVFPAVNRTVNSSKNATAMFDEALESAAFGRQLIVRGEDIIVGTTGTVSALSITENLTTVSSDPSPMFASMALTSDHAPIEIVEAIGFV
eukprot:TRINITY_DN3683_c0_g1_i1.p1 TRINITY_DN3683_c0_g1~~TRINITY_DN3683_c0_g1_i1.p1  ORF type:complete len:609 (-),score=140.50 TRINITY_DN3683_c0_g1_i1:168-1994(-)